MTDDIGKLVARLSVSVLLLFHGVHKLLNGVDSIKHLVAQHNLPEMLCFGVYVGEIVGPLLVVFGVFSRVGGLLIVLNMAVAVYLADIHRLFTLNGQGGYALELEAFYFLGGLCVMLLGAGRFSLGGANGHLN